MTKIRQLHDDGKITLVGIYSIPAKQALVCHVEQTLKHNMNFWDYPECLPEMREATLKPGVWFYDDGKNVFGAWET